MQKLTDFESKIFNKSKGPISSKIWNNEYNFEIDLNSAISKLSQNKAPGLDHIPSEWLTSIANNDKLKLKLTNIFKEWVCKSEVPKFWMARKLILLNKEKNNHPLIENTRPITILPSITKMLELSIIHNLEKWIYEDKLIIWNQRGLMKGLGTKINIMEVINYGLLIRETNKNTRLKGYFIFIDLKKAYDSVDRNILINKLDKKKIWENITKLIKFMLSNFKITIDSKRLISISNCLPQGSWLSHSSSIFT